MSAKVLLVDDEKDFLDIMVERMEARGMDDSTACSAEDALMPSKWYKQSPMMLSL
jgi:ActR/RegA family two-component response regulator